MRITHVEVVGFRGIWDFTLPLPKGENVVFFGMNGTGKTSLAQALHFALTGDLPAVSDHAGSSRGVHRHKMLKDKDVARVHIGFVVNGNAEYVERTLDAAGTVSATFSSPAAEQATKAALGAFCFVNRGRFATLIDAAERDRWTRLSPLLGHQELAAYREGLRAVSLCPVNHARRSLGEPRAKLTRWSERHGSTEGPERG